MQAKTLLILPITLGLIGNGLISRLLAWDYPPELRDSRRESFPQLAVSATPIVKPQAIAQGNPVQIQLQIHERIAVEDENGNTEIRWLELPPPATVEPGDIVRYTLTAENNSDRPVRNFTLTQPIPEQMVYLPDSATSSNEARITYSIDNGETFIETPTVTVTRDDGSVETKPALPEAYTHVRWTFPNPLPPEGTAIGQFQVRVK